MGRGNPVQDGGGGWRQRRAFRDHMAVEEEDAEGVVSPARLAPRHRSRCISDID